MGRDLLKVWSERVSVYVVALALFFTAFLFFLPSKHHVFADAVTTSVTVGNTAPTFSVNPAENPASYGTTPTNVGANVTFQATGTDSNSEDYYLAVCTTNAVTAVNGNPPTCDVGTWCVSTATGTGVQASCNYTALVGDAESEAWYAFVCDGNASSAACSTEEHGTGDSGTPFKVNHRPVFNTISNDGPKNPGADVTWSTDASTTDSDTDTVADTVRLIVCKTTGITDDDCDGGASDRWCQSSYVANNPSCAYTLPTPTVDQSYNAYVYIVDNHYFPSTGAHQEENSTYSASNVAPVVSSVTINSGGAITLAENQTTTVTLTATVTDNNACGDIASVSGYMYRSAIGYSPGCDADGDDNNNHCYANITCSVVASGNTCDDNTDASADYECDVSTQYHADPTVADTQYPTHTWLDTLYAADEALNHNAEVAAGVEMNTTIALNVTASINYGNLNVGQKNDPLDKVTTVTATGNVGLDEELKGTDMTGDPAGTITVGYQHYALAGSTAYASGTSLTVSDVLQSTFNCNKTTDHTSPATKDTWWGLEIPVGTIYGTYSGTNTVTAAMDDSANW